jgi:hypothetical protein
MTHLYHGILPLRFTLLRVGRISHLSHYTYGDQKRFEYGTSEWIAGMSPPLPPIFSNVEWGEGEVVVVCEKNRRDDENDVPVCGSLCVNGERRPETVFIVNRGLLLVVYPVRLLCVLCDRRFMYVYDVRGCVFPQREECALRVRVCVCCSLLFTHIPQRMTYVRRRLLSHRTVPRTYPAYNDLLYCINNS